jgi:DNA-binding PadR family transcriptional regulator
MDEPDEKAARFLPLTEATYLVLVSLVEPRHGYGIMQNVTAVSGGRIKLGPGTLYGALTNLLKQRLIERAGEQETQGERRKIYALTALGRAAVVGESQRLEKLVRIGRRAAARLSEAQQGEKR